MSLQYVVNRISGLIYRNFSYLVENRTDHLIKQMSIIKKRITIRSQYKRNILSSKIQKFKQEIFMNMLQVIVTIKNQINNL